MTLLPLVKTGVNNVNETSTVQQTTFINIKTRVLLTSHS